MKRFEYTEFQIKNEDKKSELELKFEDNKLPFFATEVPNSTKRNESEDVITVTHNWNDIETPWIRVKSAEFLKGEELETIYSLNIRDGVERVSVKRSGFTYVLRRAARIVARSLFLAFKKTKVCLEKIVGYLLTLGGNTYIISRINKGSWSFDNSIKDENVTNLSLENLDSSQKNKLFELIADKITDMHSNRFLFRNFSLENVIVTNDNVLLADPRNIRATRKLSLLVDEFKYVLKSLISLGMNRGHAYHAIIVYTCKAKNAANEWYEQEYGRQPNDALEVAGEIEKSVY